MKPAPGLSRRELLLSALSAAATTALPAAALAAVKPATPDDTRLHALLGEFAEELLRLSPTTATSLGLDSGARAGLKAQLDDASFAADEQWGAQVKSMLARLQKIDRGLLTARGQIQYDTVRYSANAGIDGLRFPFGGAAAGFHGGTAPFPVTQQDGAITSIPEFLDSQHIIKDGADAEAYLARLAALGKVLDAETTRW